jgi:hypothetical protein
MKRVPALVLTLASVGCCLPSERDALKPLAPEGRLFTYRELVARARLQATTAVESFYLDAWTEMEQAAAMLEQTARFLPRTTDQPEHLKKVLMVRSSSLRDDAVRLADAARNKDVQAATDALQQIHLAIRALRAVD